MERFLKGYLLLRLLQSDQHKGKWNRNWQLRDRRVDIISESQGVSLEILNARINLIQSRNKLRN